MKAPHHLSLTLVALKIAACAAFACGGAPMSVEDAVAANTDGGASTGEPDAGTPADAVSAANPLEAGFPATGAEVAGLSGFEQELWAIMQSTGAHGASIAAMKAGRLVYARGLGFADVASGRLVVPDELARLASNSKMFTAYATMLLAQNGTVDLSNAVFAQSAPGGGPAGYLADLVPKSAIVPPEWVTSMTVLDHLQMCAGWATSLDNTLLYMPGMSAIPGATGTATPATAPATITYAIGWEAPAYAPQTQQQYSDVSMLVLGRIIERLSGASYADYVQEAVLGPMGITEAALASPTFDESQAAARSEMLYYPLTPLGPSVDPSVMVQVPPAYGQLFYLPTHDAAGGWAASAPDMLRFLRAWNNEGAGAGPTGPLNQTSSDSMFARPAAVPSSVTTYYGMGGIKVERDPVTDAILRFTKYGDFTGTYAVTRYLPSRQMGLVFLVNADVLKTLPNVTAMDDFEVAALAVDGQDGWPSGDLFDQYPR